MTDWLPNLSISSMLLRSGIWNWQLKPLCPCPCLYFWPRYGEVVDVNLVRDKGTGKSKGFAFLAYEDQRSTVLAVGQF